MNSIHSPSIVSPGSMATNDIYTDINQASALKYESDKDVALKKVAKQFESMFVHMMLKSMRSANAEFEKDSIFNSKESQFFRDMSDQQMAATMSEGRGIGIADVLYRQLSKKPDTAEMDLEKTFNLDQSKAIPFAVDKSINLDQVRALMNNAHKAFEIDASHVKPSDDMGSEDVKKSAQKEQDKTPLTPEQFVEKLLPYAKKIGQALGVDEKVLLAQSALETGWGNHIIADKNGNSSHNYFNIKADSRWGGDAVVKQTLEFENATFKSQLAPFRQYQNPNDSFNDYAKFIKENPRYDAALGSNSPEDYIQIIHQAGYATDPNYSDKVVKVMERVDQIITKID